MTSPRFKARFLKVLLTVFTFREQACDLEPNREDQELEIGFFIGLMMAFKIKNSLRSDVICFGFPSHHIKTLCCPPKMLTLSKSYSIENRLVSLQ